MNKYLFIFYFLIFKTHLSIAQISNYETETIYLKSGVYIKDGKEYPRGFFGGKLKDEMKVNDEVISIFEKYQNKRKVIFACGVYMFTAFILASTVKNEPIKLGLMVTGTISGTIIFPLSRSANNDLNKSLWLRNRYILK